MVTSNKSLENKAVTMSDKKATNAGPPRTLIDEVNPHLTCVLCRGYYIDATTIVECLHSFCRSCIVKHLQTKSYCPVCEMMINSAKPNIKPDKALQDIVYKLVPGLFQREMERRQQFYASHPGPAASATPEQRGEDTERIIFSPEDVISFSLEYIDSTETDSASSKSSESGNDISNSTGVMTRRYLQCPAVVNISHLKKFLSMKFDIDLSQFCIDILYKRLALPDYYTLIDVAYIYNWKRIEPMRFFYQIVDFSTIRNRFGLFGFNRHLLRKRKRPLALDIRSGSPLLGSLDPSSDGSSGANSPLPEDSLSLQSKEKSSLVENDSDQNKNICEGRLRSSKVVESEKFSPISPSSKTANIQSPPPDEEKSQFLNSFELTAKSKLSPSPVKNAPASGISAISPSDELKESQNTPNTSVANSNAGLKDELLTKRKLTLDIENRTDNKRARIEESTTSPIKKEVKAEQTLAKTEVSASPRANISPKKCSESVSKPALVPTLPKSPQPTLTKELDSKQTPPKIFVKSSPKSLNLEEKVSNKVDDANSTSKRLIPPIKLNPTLPVKRKLSTDANSNLGQQIPKLVQGAPMKIPISESLSLKPNNTFQSSQNKTENRSDSKEIQPKVQTPVNKSNVKIGASQPCSELNQDKRVNSNQSFKNNSTQSSGDPLKSLFDSCKINIPSSLSITLSDQKVDQKASENTTVSAEQKKHPHKAVNTTMTSNLSNPAKTPSPPVHNFIEILKLPETEGSKNFNKNDVTKPNASSKTDSAPSAKGPVPNLKPISEGKSGKSGTFSKPQTFQQTFLQSLQKQQQTEKTKIIKNKLSIPKLTSGLQSSVKPSEAEQPANGNFSSQNLSKNGSSNLPTVADAIKPLPSLAKSDSALDLSTPHHPQNPLALQQTKALETMQSIANLAKKQNYPQKTNLQTLPPSSFNQSNLKSTNQSHLRIPMPTSQTKQSIISSPLLNAAASNPREVSEYFQPLKMTSARGNNSSPIQPAKSTASQNNSMQPSRAQTRSPSSSPKLVIACPSPKSQSPEEKQLVSPGILDNSNQSNQISSSQISSTNTSSGESSNSKDAPKTSKQAGLPSIPKLTNVRLPNQKLSTSSAASPADILHHLPPQVLAQQAYIRQQLELQNQFGLLHPGTAAQWFQLNSNSMARTHFENIMKSMSHNVQNPFNNHHKDGKS